MVKAQIRILVLCLFVNTALVAGTSISKTEGSKNSRHARDIRDEDLLKSYASDDTGSDSQNDDSLYQADKRYIDDVASGLVGKRYGYMDDLASGLIGKRYIDNLASGLVGKRYIDDLASGLVGAKKKRYMDDLASGLVGKRKPFDDLASGLIGKRYVDDIASGLIKKRYLDGIASGLIDKRTVDKRDRRFNRRSWFNWRRNDHWDWKRPFDDLASGLIGKRKRSV